MPSERRPSTIVGQVGRRQPWVGIGLGANAGMQGGPPSAPPLQGGLDRPDTSQPQLVCRAELGHWTLDHFPGVQRHEN